MAMHKIKSVLFDIDGTLTDSAAGMIKCYKCTFKRAGIEIPSPEVLLEFIDLPLRANLAGYLPEHRIEEGIGYYYDCYDMMRVGLTDNSVYEGLLDVLKSVKEADIHMTAVTTKIGELALPILNLFSLDQFFQNVYGSPRDQGCMKHEVVSCALRGEGLDPSTTVIVGDRSYDIHAAKQNGMRSIGVAWGYGGEEELRKAGADHIVSNPKRLAELLLA